MPPVALLILSLLAAATPEPPAPPPPAKLEFPLAGYRINAPDSPTKTLRVFTMYLPGPGQSRSPVLLKVRSEPTKKERPSVQNIADVKSVRAHNGDTILLERTLSPTEWLMEYTSNVAETGAKTETKTHAYQRVVSAKGMTYNISATAPEAQWPEWGPKLKACVDSFEVSSVSTPGKVVFPQQGYRISVLDGTAPANANQTLLQMPGGVLVGISPYTKTIEEYKARHEPDTFRGQITIGKKDGQETMTISPGQMKVLTEYAPVANALVTEYAEEIVPNRMQPRGGRSFIYEKVVFAHGQRYWAAGIYDEGNNAVSYAQIKACVDSLEAMPAPVPAPTSASAPAPAPAK